jgi:hypothetical protein
MRVVLRKNVTKKKFLKHTFGENFIDSIYAFDDDQVFEMVKHNVFKVVIEPDEVFDIKIADKIDFLNNLSYEAKMFDKLWKFV